eukprot:GHVP01007934.1.p1 GENE.GHVP01007934.1~~GHVP01007934.1.p1  ORF type:complete len:167 (+),score=11.08 GHVP01007934.1:362-862(+)
MEWKKHLEYLHSFLELTRKANLFLNLGHFLRQDRVTIDPTRIERFKAIPLPRDLFVEPLHDLTKGPQVCNRRILMTSEAFEAFKESKRAIVNSTALTLPDPNIPFVMHTDASNTAMGAALSQASMIKEVGVEIRTDHKPLLYLTLSEDPKLQRWSFFKSILLVSRI